MDDAINNPDVLSIDAIFRPDLCPVGPQHPMKRVRSTREFIYLYDYDIDATEKNKFRFMQALRAKKLMKLNEYDGRRR